MKLREPKTPRERRNARLEEERRRIYGLDSRTLYPATKVRRFGRRVSQLELPLTSTRATAKQED
jgi:hypothetical protein